MFRAFLHLSKHECDTMGLDDYFDYMAMFREVMKFFHAPYNRELD